MSQTKTRYHNGRARAAQPPLRPRPVTLESCQSAGCLLATRILRFDSDGRRALCALQPILAQAGTLSALQSHKAVGATVAVQRARGHCDNAFHFG